jgi:hypothetical protein
MGCRRSEGPERGNVRGPPGAGGVFRMKRYSAMLGAVLALVVVPVDCAGAVVQDLGATYEFLVSERSTKGGALHSPTAYRKQGVVLPFSFRDSEQFWGEYVCGFPDKKCAVADVYNPADYTLKPREAEAGVLQNERVDVHNGANIYDVAVWQIAVVLGSVVNGFTNFVDADAYHLATHQNRVLADAEGHAAVGNTPLGKRAVTRDGQYRYNDHDVQNPTSAYSFRMGAPTWLVDDPLMDSRYASLVTAGELPRDNPEYRQGRITWADWRPVTGENAWAYLLGPLQAAYIHYVVGRKGKCVPFEELAVRNALEVLPTFAAMQSPLGAVYYAPSHTGDQPASAHLVSVENNFSLYAGLQVLTGTLEAELASGTHLSQDDKRRIRVALALIRTMVSGGQLPDHRVTAGLLSFFKNAAWDGSEFVQGGFANDPTQKGPWVPVPRPRAVDVNTWGVAALGAHRIDEWFGFGAAFRIWSEVKSWGAYGVGHALWGVGYSDQDGNGLNPDGTYKQGVLSGEWTAGAIVMVRNMIRHYGEGQRPSSGVVAGAGAEKYARGLREDESAMLEAVQSLRFDRYQHTDFPGKPAGYQNLIVEASEPYLYASRRHLIPFGWYANPLPSTASTAWMVMVADGFDPFGYGGAPN